jgi:hypothetical protein
MQQQISFASERPEEDVNVGTSCCTASTAALGSLGGGIGMEMSIHGADSELLGSGDLRDSTRSSRPAIRADDSVSAGTGFLLNTGSQPQVFNWSVQGVVRGTQLFSFRTEITGRLFNDVGETFNDVAILPGLDFNLTDNIIIRPEGLSHLSSDAVNWGIGVGFVFTM